MRRFRSVIIPVEIKAREFDAKLLLACMAAKRGLTAYVGSRFRLNLFAERVPTSIRLEKGLTGGFGWKGQSSARNSRTTAFRPYRWIRARARRLHGVNPVVPEVTIEQLSTNIFRVEHADRPSEVEHWRWRLTAILP